MWQFDAVCSRANRTATAVVKSSGSFLRFIVEWEYRSGTSEISPATNSFVQNSATQTLEMLHFVQLTCESSALLEQFRTVASSHLQTQVPFCCNESIFKFLIERTFCCSAAIGCSIWRRVVALLPASASSNLLGLAVRSAFWLQQIYRIRLNHSN